MDITVEQNAFFSEHQLQLQCNKLAIYSVRFLCTSGH